MHGDILQKLSNPFVKEDGGLVKTKEEWRIQREYIKNIVFDIGYGGMPPDPEQTTAECFSFSGKHGASSYMVTAKAGEKTLSFELRLHVPFSRDEKEIKKYPVILDGDNNVSSQTIEKLINRGIIAAQFNRCAIVKDVNETEEILKSPIYRLFPGIKSGSIAGWAWGFSRCIDVLEELPFVDTKNIAITGHSRGGKAVLLAGAADERAAIVNPNCSGAGGGGCWRYRISDGKNRNETLSDLFKGFPSWMGPKMKAYTDRETDLPFDQHYLKALVAPRYYLQTEGTRDFWCNPPGSHGTLMAAREVYRFLDCPEKILAHYRYGGHAHTPEDYEILADIIDVSRGLSPIDESLLLDLYPETSALFDWKRP
jgi:hypothetical protein